MATPQRPLDGVQLVLANDHATETGHQAGQASPRDPAWLTMQVWSLPGTSPGALAGRAGAQEELGR